jgi:hypothetical protein
MKVAIVVSSSEKRSSPGALYQGCPMFSQMLAGDTEGNAGK